MWRRRPVRAAQAVSGGKESAHIYMRWWESGVWWNEGRGTIWAWCSSCKACRHVSRVVLAEAHGLFRDRLFHPYHSLFHRGKPEQANGDGSFEKYVAGVVYDRIGQGAPSFPGIGSEKDPAGKH